ncbi:MAG: hypothetical protein GF329_07060 [Candidatus Lokiarchaeota archaeon]|nr:hypothetical protein [Candidatus Lokiarchaeota archaeon]
MRIIKESKERVYRAGEWSVQPLGKGGLVVIGSLNDIPVLLNLDGGQIPDCLKTLEKRIWLKDQEKEEKQKWN